MKQTKKQTEQTASVATVPKSNKGRWLLVATLAVLAVMVVLWVGVRSQAAGWRQLEYIEAQNVYEDYQDDISYLFLSHKDAVWHARNYQKLCSVNTFNRYFERVVEGARVDFEDDLKDRDVSYVCFRVGLSNGNYVYSAYSFSGGAGGPRITIEGLSQDGSYLATLETKHALKRLAVSSGIPYPEEDETPPDIEYVGLEETGEACDADAFIVEGRPIFNTESNGQVDLALFGLAGWSITEERPATPAAHPAVALCFRTRVDAEYAYEKYGDVKADIFFHIGGTITESGEFAGQVSTYAPLADTLEYVPMEPGAVCSARVFDAGVLADLKVARPPIVGEGDEQMSPEALVIYSETLSAHTGFCFKADFGNGNVLYKAHEREIEYVRIKVVWKFEVWTYQYNEDLGITSARDIKSWRAVRSDYWQGNQVCDDTMFEQKGQLQGVISGDLSQGEEFNFSIRLNNDDVGRLYCIEITDNEDNKAYATSQILYRPTLFGLYVIQDKSDDQLIAVTYGGERLGESKPHRLSENYTTWFVARADSDGTCDYSVPSLSYEYGNGPDAFSAIYVPLAEGDYSEYFCFKATRNYSNGEAATARFRIFTFPPPVDPVTPDPPTPSNSTSDDAS